MNAIELEKRQIIRYLQVSYYMYRGHDLFCETILVICRSRGVQNDPRVMCKGQEALCSPSSRELW